MCKNFTIKNPREYRILKSLLSDIIFRKKLNEIAGAINSPQNIKDIRDRSKLSIPCEHVEMRDRDGNRCRPGRYWLTEQDKIIAREAIEKWENSAATPSPTDK